MSKKTKEQLELEIERLTRKLDIQLKIDTILERPEAIRDRNKILDQIQKLSNELLSYE
jgi:hypothetical protein